MECGKEGMVYKGLCEECLPKKRALLELPPYVTLQQCPHCNAYRHPGGWRRSSLEDALDAVIAKEVKVPRDVRRHHLSLSSTSEGGKSLLVHLSARLDLEGMVVEEDRDLEVRIKGSTCPQCSRKHGQYYEAIIQVRAQGRSLREDEVAGVHQTIDERVRGDPSLFITREEMVHGGLDVYLSSNEAAKSIIRELKSSLGGRMSSSPRLQTRKGGREVYRVTYALRLPRFSAGDLVEAKGRLYRVLSSGEPAAVLDLRSGERGTMSHRELRKAKEASAREIQGIVVSQTDGDIEVVDPETYEVRRVPKPKGLDLKDERVALVITDDEAFIAPLMEE